jgi:hypothetical protein
VGVSSLIRFWNPPPQGCVVGLQGSFPQQLLDITIRKEVSKVPGLGSVRRSGQQEENEETRNAEFLKFDAEIRTDFLT